MVSFPALSGVVEAPNRRCIRRAAAWWVSDRKLGTGQFACHHRDARKPGQAMGGYTSWNLSRLKGAAANNTIGTKDATRGADLRW